MQRVTENLAANGAGTEVKHDFHKLWSLHSGQHTHIGTGERQTNRHTHRKREIDRHTDRERMEEKRNLWKKFCPSLLMYPVLCRSPWGSHSL